MSPTRPFRRLLVANRGEIAVRVIRTCHRLGIQAVLAASEADLDSTAARMADEVVVLGPAAPARSYLDVDAVVGAAVRARVDALHPGYGFLSENADLARGCNKAGVVFVGPTADVLDAVGDKLSARRHAVAAGLPVVPGAEVATAGQAHDVAESVGYPLLVKAVAGGGGRGLKRVDDPAALAPTLDLATAEAQAAFGNRRVYVERFVASGRHVEVQVLGDGERIVHLGDRDCSVQRRYQKLLEEAPAPLLDPRVRAGLHEAAVALARQLAYRGLGTVEFLVDRDSGDFFFLEMNARIQVEHPVTELITGLDLVAEQLAMAEGHPLRLAQNQVTLRGHAVECRINAEDWRADFRPDPGTVTSAVFPVGDGVRVDTHVQPGTVIAPYYDSSLAKVVVHGIDRDDALRRLRVALARTRIDGVRTTLDLHRNLVDEPELRAGGVDSRYLAGVLAALLARPAAEGA